MNTETLQINIEPPIATVTLNRPNVLNAFNEHLVLDLRREPLAPTGRPAARSRQPHGQDRHLRQRCVRERPGRAIRARRDARRDGAAQHHEARRQQHQRPAQYRLSVPTGPLPPEPIAVTAVTPNTADSM